MQQSSFTSAKHGYDIATYSWEPLRDDARAVVLLVHGVHSSSLHSFYAPSPTPETDYNPPTQNGSLVQALVADNFAVHAHDHLGHGASSGLLPAYFSLDDLVADTLQHLDVLLQAYRASALPVFMVGSSLGGLVACLAAIRRPTALSGIYLCAPLLGQPKLSWPALLMRSVSPAIAWLFDSREVISLSPPHNEMLRRYWRACSLTWKGGLRATPGHTIIQGYIQLDRQLALLNCPIAAIVGEMDTVVSVDLVSAVLDRLPVKDKRMMCVPGMGHTPFLEEGRMPVLHEVTEWLRDRCPSPPVSPISSI